MAIQKFDSHVHFNHHEKSPYQDLKDKLSKSNISKCLLILNTERDEEIFWYNFERIKDDGVISSVAAYLDVKNDDSLQFFEKCGSIGIKACIKLHPRISRITVNEFDSIIKKIHKIDLETIIVDNFIYGPQLENHIGTELAVTLAEEFSEKKIVLAHAGGCDMLRTMLITRPLSNIYYDYSLTCNYLENTSVRMDMVNGLRFYKKRIMFGTDYPDFQFSESCRAMEALCKEAGLSEEETTEIFWGNACKIYGRDKIK